MKKKNEGNLKKSLSCDEGESKNEQQDSTRAPDNIKICKEII